MVITVPPLRRTMCTGTDRPKSSAQLFRPLTVKNMKALMSKFGNGMARGLRENCPLIEEWNGNAKSVTTKN